MMESPAALLALINGDEENFIAASTPGGIEAQEARGQETFVQSQTLPKECPKEQLESLGFKFGDDFDDIFVSVEFPEGWDKVATEHSMHSDLIDEKGRKRGSIFYKAAFYDRSAHMSLSSRYTQSQRYDLEGSIQFQVFDGDNVIFNTDAVVCEAYSDEYFAASEMLQRHAGEYLQANYPEHRSPTAYWD